MMHRLARGSLPLRFSPTSFHLICPRAQPFLSGSLKSCVIILSVCVSEPVSTLANLCHTEETATVVGASKRSRKRREVKSKQKKTKKQKTWLTTYKAVACIRSVARQTNEGREPHDKRSRYGAGA